MAVELYNHHGHVCLAFYDLVGDDHEQAVQCNQFLVVDNGHGALIDPGGNMTYNRLLVTMQKYFPSKHLDYVLASHADPDIIGSINKWFVASDCRVAISQLWTRFVPHLTTGRDLAGRVLGIPDEGMNLAFGGATIKALPAHFLHAEGNIQFYDPVSKILFSGDMGSSLVPNETAAVPVRSFSEHIPFMAGFHRRYMVSNKICRLWVNMIRELDVEMIVPQHGNRFVGKKMVDRFLDWVEGLSCGVDLMTQDNYRIP